MNINRIISQIASHKLFVAAKISEKKLQRLKNEDVFNSKTLQDFLSDRFEYKGSEPNIVLVKDCITGNPVEAYVDIVQEHAAIGNMVREVYRIWTKDKKNLLGKKEFFIKKHPSGNIYMVHGYMESFNPTYCGIGLRLDQMQIERALQLGIKSIPRISYSQAILFHTKMGFLPSTVSLIKLQNLKEVKKFSENEFKLAVYDIPVKNMCSNPFIIKKGSRYYLDVNKTVSFAAIDLCKNILKKTGECRVTGMDIAGMRLTLSKKELKHWKGIIKKHSILSKLQYSLEKPFKKDVSI